MHRTIHRALLSFAAILSLAAFVRGGELSLATLLDDMTNLSAMAEYPSPAYTTKQFSSYERTSKTPADHDAWFANGDCGVYLRTEDHNGRKEFVQAEMQGPGAIVRLWSANPYEGVLRIYLDGSDKPALEYKYADLLSGKHPLLPSPIGAKVSEGWNLYLPIPYAKSCKVTCDKDGQYYHVNYRTYPAGTEVKTFTVEQLEAAAKDVAKVAKQLENPASALVLPQQVNTVSAEPTLPPSSVVDLPGFTTSDPDHSFAIAQIKVKVDLPADQIEAALRSVIVRMIFDGEQTVEAPLGDFFGAAPGINPYASLPVGVEKDGTMYCHWCMPFAKSYKMSLENLGKTPVPLKMEIVSIKRPWTPNTMHFHAKWKIDFDLPTRPMIDWNYLDATGKGVFAGAAFFLDNPVKHWWGEGDEKIYVDGESFPSHFGTGTEDYYGYAWCCPTPFTHAYHAQPRCDGPANYGRTSVNRFHILDRIPFEKSFKFDMEIWHWGDCKINAAVLVYYYALPGAKDTFKPLTAEQVALRPMPAWAPPKVAGAIEGEILKVIKRTGSLEAQPWDDLSNGEHLWWREGKPNDEIILGFDAPKAGKYEVVGRFMSAKDYGKVQLAVNGAKAGEPIDFYNAEVKATPEISLGTFELKEGENQISAVLVGANDKAVKSYMFGLDYLLLKPAK